MNEKTLVTMIIFISVFLLVSTSATVAYKPNLPKESRTDKIESNAPHDEQTINGKMLLRSLFLDRNKDQLLDFLTSSINTVYNNDVEKSSEIIFGLFNDLDVDNNDNTGVDGKDIRVQYFVLPYISLTPEFTIGAVFSVSVELLTEDIKDNAFSLSATLGENRISVGYESPEDQTNNTIPDRIKVSTMVFFQPNLDTTGFTFNLNPTYESNQAEKQIILFAGFDDTNVERTYAFGFQPASETQITITSTRNPDEWEYVFTKDSAFDTVFTAEMTRTTDRTTKQTTLTIDSLPNEISFSLALTPFTPDGGSIQYQSETMYDVSVLVETEEIGRCKYALIENTPRQLSAEWIPSRENGYYHITIDSDGTTIYLLNSLRIPTINISISDLSTVDLTTYWNLTNPGDIEIFKDPSLHIDLDILFEDWDAEIDAEPTAEHIYFSWKSNVSGYLTFDTDQIPLSDIDLLIHGPENGIRIIGETLAAEDFHLEWTVWPLSDFYVDRTGSIDFFSLSIDVFVNDQWYHLWPLL